MYLVLPSYNTFNLFTLYRCDKAIPMCIHIYIYSFTFISVLQCFKQQYSVLIKYNFYLLYNGIFFCLFIHRIHHVVVYCSGIVVFIMQKLWKSFLDMSFFPPVFYIYFALLKSCLH